MPLPLPLPQSAAPCEFPAPERPISHPQLRILTVFLLSLLLLVPCFWHSHIQAGDVGSHVYNAWLAQLIHRGQAPGLFLTVQWKNVLFDLLLFYLCKLFGFALGEKLAVSLCVLLFFWGLFAFLRAATGRAPWFLTPVLAMLSYGYVFYMGFMNYYLSIGLACLALACMWNFRPRGLIAAAFLLPLLYLAHPVGFLFFAGVAAYHFIHEGLPGRWKLALPILAIAALIVLHFYLVRNTRTFSIAWPPRPKLQWNGIDQFRVFGPAYNYIALAMVVFALLIAALALRTEKNDSANWKTRLFFAELYLVTFAALRLLPQDLRFQAQGGWIGELVTRLTVAAAIFAVAVLATLRPRLWHLAGFTAIALFYFAFVYRDTGILERMERNAEALTRSLPFGTRVVSTVYSPPGFRPFYDHFVDRACIGYCYLYSNYEPATLQFRVRVRPEGSPLVAETVVKSEGLQFGSYAITEADPPLKQIYQCDSSDLIKLCIRDLHAGERSGQFGYRPEHFPWEPE